MKVNHLLRQIEITIEDLSDFIKSLNEEERAKLNETLGINAVTWDGWFLSPKVPNLASGKISDIVLCENKHGRRCLGTYDFELKWWNTPTHYGEVVKWCYLPL